MQDDPPHRDADGRSVRLPGALVACDAGRRADSALARMHRLYALQGGIAEAIAAEPGNARTLLQRVCSIAVERGGFAFAASAGIGDEGRWQPLCAAGADAGYLELVRQRAADPHFTDWPLAAAVAQGRLVMIDDIAADARMRSWAAPMRARGWRTAALLPLQAGDGHPGGLVLLGADPGSFGADEAQLLQAIGRTLAHALLALRQRAAREAAEATLRRSEAELRSAQRIAGVGSWSFDPQQRRLHLSAAAMAALGKAAEPFEGTPREFLSWIRPEDRERARLAMRATSSADSMYEVEHCVQREDGGIGWVLARAEPVAQPGGGTLWIGSVLDITARKQTELRLREQVERLALLGRITRAIGDRTRLQAVLDIVADQIALHLPAQLCALLLHDPEQPQRLQLAAASGSAAATLRAALAGPGAAAALAAVPRSMPVLSEAGEVLPRLLAAAGLASAEQLPLAEPGAAPGMMLLARAAPRAFDARETEFLQQLAEHVALAVRQARLHGDLRHAYEQLERTQAARLQQERLAALGSMSGGAAHDINNALSPAALYVESLLSREAGLSERGRGQLEAIQRAIEDVSGTLERMRAFAHRDRAEALPGIDLGELVRGFAGQADAR